MSSIGVVAARATKCFIPNCKADYIFLKVQTPSYDVTYSMLENCGDRLEPDCRYGLRNNLLGVPLILLNTHYLGTQTKGEGQEQKSGRTGDTKARRRWKHPCER